MLKCAGDNILVGRDNDDISDIFKEGTENCVKTRI